MTDEIICECGHTVNEHALDGCDFGKYETDCLCTFTPARIYKIETERQAVRLAALTLAVGERDAKIEKLREELIWAYGNMSFLEYPAADDAEYEFCKECHEPEWSHKTDCKGMAHSKQAQILIAETAPATEAGK